MTAGGSARDREGRGKLLPGGPAVKDLRALRAERLAPFKVPTEWRFLGALPKTTTQKVQKDALRAACVSGREGGKSPAAPTVPAPARDERA